MNTHRMTIENREYLLAGTVDAEALQLEVCDAIRRGGGIVRFEAAVHRSMTAIVSPGVPVLFEEVDVPDQIADSRPVVVNDGGVAGGELDSYLEGY